ncbi:hypothetical protein BGZ65_005965 [Modicella reniformis]|uniref:CNH domain-containing protein n=1 Tax=Modicella reniformis TaxID=1440133 RepID=A0A9P6MLP2_9FUNG|nr:hypothetical protein BGZ65_005965 [Modicella reniformis]
MFTTFTVQPLLRGVHLDDASVIADTSRSLLDRPSAGALPGSVQGIFNRNTKPVVESLDTFENHLYLGTSDGFLLHYMIEEQISSESELPRSRLIKRKALGVGKKVVEKITVFSKLRLAIVLCDSALSFFSLPDFSPFPPQTFPLIKGVTAFCEDASQKGLLAEDGSVQLCVTKRRTIQFFSELNLPNGALVVTRWKNVVCVADAGGFNIIDTRVGRMIPVLPVVQNTQSGSNTQVLKPVCTSITENEFLLASTTSSGQTAIGIFCTGSGDPVRGTLQWSSYPRALAVEYPYVIALLKGNIIEVHNILDQKLVQNIRFESSVEVRALMQSSGLKVWMSTLANVLALETINQDTQHRGDWSLDQEANRISIVLARVLIAGKDTVSALVTTPLVLHAESLLQRGRVEEALLLSERTTATISPENLHRERLQLELDYIYQKSGLIHLGETLFDDGFDLLRRGKMDARVVVSMFPDVKKGDPGMVSRILDQLTNHMMPMDSAVDMTHSRSGSEQGDELRNMLLKNAKDIFLQYLTRFRKEHSSRKGHAGSQSEAVDTALLGLWVDNGDSASLRQLLESNNSCIADLSEQKLKEANKHYALSIWYRTRKNYVDVNIKARLLLGELEDNSFDVGLQEMASFVSSLQDASLVEDYGWWIVEQDEVIGLKIFMPGDAKRAAMFDPDRVLARHKSTLSRSGLIAYLEYVVLQRKSESLEHHRMLGLMYVEAIAHLVTDPAVQAKHQEMVTEFSSSQERHLLGLNRNELRPIGSESSSGTFVSHLQSNAKSDLVCNYRVKLVQLLQSSTPYNPTEFLPQVEAVTQLQFEKAILLSRLGKHDECIKVLVRDVKDYQGAEIFCLNSGVFRNPRRVPKAHSLEATPKELLSDLEKRKKLLMMLLQEYLHMAQEQGGLMLTLRLLDSQSSYLDLSEVIHMLPPFWSVELLQRYLLRSLRRSYHEFKEIQVIKGLSLGENLKISEELSQLYESQGPVVITADVICHVCGTAVADDVFVRTADMKILANYSLAYKRIKNAAFDGPGTRSTVLFFVAADVDAICAFRMWATLLKSDCISYVVVPVAGMDDIRSEVKNMSSFIRSIVMLNCGGLFNLEDYIEMTEEVTIYILDSHRPVNLRNAFWNNEVIVFHEADLDKELVQEKEAIIFTEEHEYESRNGHGPDSDDDLEEGDRDEDEDEDEDGDDEDDEGDEHANYRQRRRRTGLDTEVLPEVINRKWKQSRAIIGHKEYLDIVRIYKDESERLMSSEGQALNGRTEDSGRGLSTEEGTIQCTDEYRFMMVRHWSLYESMYHSNYVASHLGIWREPGRKRLLALLAKMGFSLEQCNQVFAHMDIDLKKILKDRLESVAPEYGLNEILYTSFTRSYGYRGLVSASDVVYAVTSLLEASPEAQVALGHRSERITEVPLGAGVSSDADSGQDDSQGRISWWHTNFFRACDSLDGGGGEEDQLRQGLKSCMKMQQAVVRQAIAIIEKQVIITLSTCRVATLKDGPDLPIFWNPLTLSKLAQFLVYAIREYGSRKAGYRPIPLVVAVLKEETQTFVMAGVHGSPVIGEVIPNKFGTVFEKISYNEKIPYKQLGFDKSVIEIDRDDLEAFMKSIGRYMR